MKATVSKDQAEKQMEKMERSFSFTARGLNRMLETVDDPVFQEQDAEKIIAALRDQMRVVPFCEYLKRYVYLRSGMVGSYRDVSPEEYRDTVCDAFYATETPASMKHLSTRVSTRVAGWLQQGKVRRSVVLLLGFGLSMSREDVNEFLAKALHEHQLDEEEVLGFNCYGWGTTRSFQGGMYAIVSAQEAYYAEYDHDGALTAWYDAVTGCKYDRLDHLIEGEEPEGYILKVVH